MEPSIMPPIKSLTPEQEALILVYREKWRAIVLSTEPIDRQRAEGALRAAYALVGKADPEFRFLNGPGELQELWEEQSFLNFFFGQLGELVPLYDTQFLKQLQNRFSPDLWKQIVIQPESELFELQYQLYFLATHPLSRQFNQTISEAWVEGWDRGREEIRRQPGGELLIQFAALVQPRIGATLEELNAKIWQPLTNQSFMQPVVQEWEKRIKLFQQLNVMFSNFYPTSLCPTVEFCSSILDFSDADMRCWMTLRSVVRSCGVVLPFKNLCLVIERPTRILLDAEGKIHADEEPAVTFADGSEFYAHHGDFKN
jgi:hypothetical protein